MSRVSRPEIGPPDRDVTPPYRGVTAVTCHGPDSTSFSVLLCEPDKFPNPLDVLNADQAAGPCCFQLARPFLTLGLLTGLELIPLIVAVADELLLVNVSGCLKKPCVNKWPVTHDLMFDAALKDRLRDALLHGGQCRGPYCFPAPSDFLAIDRQIRFAGLDNE